MLLNKVERSKKLFHKYAVNFQQSCWQNKTTSFVSFTLCLRLCALCKSVGEIDNRPTRQGIPVVMIEFKQFGQQFKALSSHSSNNLFYMPSKSILKFFKSRGISITLLFGYMELDHPKISVKTSLMHSVTTGINRA